jgi:phosphonate transport system substrate-binding protein
MSPSIFNIILCGLLIALLPFFPRISNAGERLVFAVHPYLPATEISEKFGPLVKYLSKELGRPIDIEISPDYQNHIIQIGKDNVDIAYMGPASYVKMADTYGRKHLLVRQETEGKPTFHGVIIVRKDNPLSSLGDLAGKRFAFGDPESTMSHLVPRYMLWKEGITLDNLGGYAFLANHHNVALGVLAGDFDAGAVKEEVFTEYEKRGLRELARTPEISDHVIVATNRLSLEQVQKLRDALHSLRGKEDSRSIMNSIKPSTSLVPAKDEDYDNLREILKALTKLGIYK